MRIVVAPDSFKGTLSATEACRAIALGALAAGDAAGVDIEIDQCPMSDGGEGFIDAICLALDATIKRARIIGPTGDLLNARWALIDSRNWTAARAAARAVEIGAWLSGALVIGAPGVKEDLDEHKTAVIECAQACGLTLVPEDRRDPERTLTYGVGQMIRRALDEGCGRIVIGLGGSATCDGGIGAAEAVGVSFRDDSGNLIGDGRRRLCGADLNDIASINWNTMDTRVREVEIVCACDVLNPLFGPDGAAHVYAPQKGATPRQVSRLDDGLAHLSEICTNADVHIDPDEPGAGAAGGMGYGLAALLGADLESGADLVIDLTLLRERLEDADLIITGEGRIDEQTFMGKVAGRVAALARDADVPVGAVTGDFDESADLSEFDAVETTAGRTPGRGADAATDLEHAAERLVRWFLGRR